MQQSSSIVNKKDVELLVKKHSLFANIQTQYGNPPNWQRPQGFTSLCKIILEQQVSLASAQAHFNKLHQYIKIFTPKNILALNMQQMRGCQISKQKAVYLQALALAIENKTLNLKKLDSLSDEEIRTQLTAIKGIGNWTTDVYLMFCLQHKNIFPLGDIALINTAKELTTTQNKDEIEALAHTWQPLKSLASFFLWHYYLSKRGRVAI